MGTGTWRLHGGRTIRLLAVAVLATVMVATLPPVVGAADSRAGDRRAAVIVRAEPGSLIAAAQQVERLGGRVGRKLRIINGFTADVPAGQLGRLSGSPAVASVTENEPVAMQAAAYTPTTDAGSLYTTTLATGAQAYWKAGYTGKGVDVAVIDTGTPPLPGLDGAGKVVNGPDLSFESQADNLRYLDAYGHGTHMAGIIVANDAATGTKGLAPDVKLTSIKVGTSNGTVDVSQVIAAVDWVVEHKNDDAANPIKVINLSYGSGGTPSNWN